MTQPDTSGRRAGIVLGVGLGGFFDGIVFHQLLQWRHMVSNWRLPENVENMGLNNWVGLFHVLTYIFVLASRLMLRRDARRPDFSGTTAGLKGAFLIGWGGFNMVEGLVDHVILGVRPM
jgi:uncharacterized membrane protein